MEFIVKCKMKFLIPSKFMGLPFRSIVVTYMTFMGALVTLTLMTPVTLSPLTSIQWSKVQHAVSGWAAGLGGGTCGQAVHASNTTKPAPGTQQHVFFLKVHKAASSSLQNIFLRYSLRHQLNVLVRRHHTQLNETGPDLPGPELLSLPPGSTHYDILANHVIYSEAVIAQWLPRDTACIGVVRQPFSQFLSAFAYFSPDRDHDYLWRVLEVNPERPIEEFLNNPLKYVGGRSPRTVQVNNRMSVDFGFPEDNFEESKRNQTQIQSFVQSVVKRFDLVLVSEYFDESLVLLRRLLGWQTRDVIHLNQNVFFSKQSPSWTDRKPEDYTEKVKGQYRSWAPIDHALYDAFLRKFKAIVSSQVNDFHNEVDELKLLKANVSSICRDMRNRGRHAYRSVVFSNLKYSQDFVLKPYDCVLMNFDENEIMDRVRLVQKNRCAIV